MSPHAANLLEFDCVASAVTDGNQPLTSEVLAEATLEDASHRIYSFFPLEFLRGSVWDSENLAEIKKNKKNNQPKKFEWTCPIFLSQDCFLL